jgi:hypothetical protein
VSEQDQTAKTPEKTCGYTRRRHGKSCLVLLLVALVSGLAGAMIAKAYDFHHGFPGGPMSMMMHGPLDVGEAEDHATWMVKHLSQRVDATAEQKTKLIVIATNAAKDLFPLHEKMVASRKRGIEILRQPVISRDDIESLRAEQFANAEAMSKRLAQAIGDSMEVLTLEQRHELASDISHFFNHWGG